MQKQRIPILALGIISLLAALWAALLRLGWRIPIIQPQLAGAHGALMVSTFLGTVIGLERAVALDLLEKIGPIRKSIYAGPILTGIGGLLLMANIAPAFSLILITIGSVMMIAASILIMRFHPAIFTAIMALGAVAWLVGNVLWLLGKPLHFAMWWWATFLILTVAGERLELNRILRLTSAKRNAFLLPVALMMVGLLIQSLNYAVSVRLIGLGLLMLALWLLFNDIARYNIKKEGLTRFIAASLFSGYIWMALGGLLALVYGGVTAGLQYDAIVHSLMLGFIMSMIFGHAPIIFPAILSTPMPYSPAFYGHLAFLHVSLIVRVVADLFGWFGVRQWGGMLNVVALLLFLGNTVAAIVKGRRDLD